LAAARGAGQSLAAQTAASRGRQAAGKALGRLLRKSEINAIDFSSPDWAWRSFGPPRRNTKRVLWHFGHGVTGEKIFFIWIRRNPLKSPDSAKGIQGNPSFFAWFYLVLLG
jgi:hypothetical protein